MNFDTILSFWISSQKVNLVQRNSSNSYKLVLKIEDENIWHNIKLACKRNLEFIITFAI